MKRVILLALIALALPVVASATSSADFTNSGGTFTGNDNGLSLTGSTIIAFGINGVTKATGNLGTLSISTGRLVSGDLQNGGTFSAGGAFTITGNGVPSFMRGTFSSPVAWNMVTLSNGTHNYTLTGVFTGIYVAQNEYTTGGVTVQLTINTGKGLFSGSSLVSSGDTNILLPEPGTIGLMGTGLAAIVGLLRRKLKILN